MHINGQNKTPVTITRKIYYGSGINGQKSNEPSLLKAHIDFILFFLIHRPRFIFLITTS